MALENVALIVKVSPINGAAGTLTSTLGVGAETGFASPCFAGNAIRPRATAATVISLNNWNVVVLDRFMACVQQLLIFIIPPLGDVNFSEMPVGDYNRDSTSGGCLKIKTSVKNKLRLSGDKNIFIWP